MQTSKVEFGAIVTIILALIGGALWLGNMQGTLNTLKSDSIESEREKALKMIRAELSDASRDLNSITAALPVGSVVPSMLKPKTFYALAKGTWRLADGTKVSNKSEYAEHVGSLQLPDLRNMFLRGASEDRNVGSFEKDSTRLPDKNFTGASTSNGAHTHPKGANHSGDKVMPGEYANMSTGIDIPNSGGHSHAITIDGGGDPETRPKNIAVNFFVKIAN
ncbi:hypothetical protein [Marinobacter sp.]|uniref:hypothetical protein n=1 Tax=Marinobacter sp. TaxID=50741 RepID=UPI00356AB762